MASMKPKDRVGTVIDNQFEILETIGAGGMGSVYLAMQNPMQRKVVVKIMHAAVDTEQMKGVERFYLEARAIARLNHPNIVQVYVCGQTGESDLYLAMEYVEGRTLLSEMKEHGKFSAERAIHIITQLASALQDAHEQNIVHRDLKPENIMLTLSHGDNDFVKVLDFGIVKMLGGDELDAALTAAGAVFGTPQYMSPEQIRQEKVDGRSDLYALGIIFYQLLTGVHPFQANSGMEYLAKHLNEEIVLPNQRFSELQLSAAIEEIVTTLLQKNPDHRYSSATELEQALKSVIKNNDIMGGDKKVLEEANDNKPELQLQSTSLRDSRNKNFWTTVGAVGGVAVLSTVVFLSQTRHDDFDQPSLQATANAVAQDSLSDEGAASETNAASTGPIKPGSSNDNVPTPSPEPIDFNQIIDIEGLPFPARTIYMTSTNDHVIGITQHHPRDVLSFYHSNLLAQCGEPTRIPNGLSYGDDCDVNYLVVTKGDKGQKIILSRVRYQYDDEHAGEEEFAMGAIVIPGAREVARTPAMVVFNVDRPVVEVMDFYHDRYSKTPGINSNRAATSETLTVADDNPDTPFRTITVMENANGEGNSSIVTVLAQ